MGGGYGYITFTLQNSSLEGVRGWVGCPGVVLFSSASNRITKGQNNMPQALGRPSNVYGMTVQNFAAKWKLTQKSTVRTFDPGFGAIGYFVQHDCHQYRVRMTPCADVPSLFWVRIETADDEVGFTIPAPMDLPTIDKELFEHWDIFEPLWVPGDLRCSTMPGVLSKHFHTSDHEFIVLVQESPEKPNLRLVKRKGIHGLPKGTFAGIIACVEELEDMEAFFVNKPPNVKFPSLDDTRPIVDKALLKQLRLVGAAWAKRWFVTHRDRTVDGLPDPGKLYPFIPHFKILQTPQFAISEFKP